MIGEGELVFTTPETAFETVRQLLTEGNYVVMLSREEQFWIVNYLYSDLCNRNDVVFMSREDFEYEYFEVEDVTLKRIKRGDGLLPLSREAEA